MKQFEHGCGCDCAPKVLDSRMASTHFRRRYRCPKCGNRFTTVEISVDEPGLGGDAMSALEEKFQKEPPFSKCLLMVVKAMIEKRDRDAAESDFGNTIKRHPETMAALI